MDSSERPHRTSTSTSERFTSRLSSSSNSSSSMKISSKSILTLGRSRDPPVSLSTSLSRRLRTNGSIKGGQSPMFPTGGGKKRGCGFENPEPSSPKVTCIGQVRLKTKKQGKKMRTLSRRRSGGGDVSFRRVDSNRERANPNQNQGFHSHPPPQECLPHRNQRWVHLPLTICEALRAFGAEFSCLFPCRSSCFSTSDRGKENKPNTSDSGQRSCGAVFARWLVALQEGEGGGRGREIELMVAGEEERERTGFRERTFRRHVGDDIEMFHDEKFVVEDEGRASICVPPKNALLLMRCRSDPNRVSALANRFTESISPQLEEEDEEDLQSEEEDFQEVHEELGAVEPIGDTNLANDPELHENLVSSDANVEGEHEHSPEDIEAEQHCVVDLEEALEAEMADISEELQSLEEAEQESVAVEANEAGHSVTDTVLADLEQSIESKEEMGMMFTESLEDEEMAMRLMLIQESEDEEGERRTNNLSCSIASSSHSDSEVEEEETEVEALSPEDDKTEEVLPTTEEKMTQETTLNEEDEKLTQEEEKSDPEEAKMVEIVDRESEMKEKSETERCSGSGSVLPDCLLLMMCEPKLSMEVSKETWVCSTDFIRFLPERPAKNVKAAAAADGKKKRVGVKSGPPPLPTQRAAKQKPPPHIQPGRSSCSLPTTAAKSMANMIEQKLVNAVAYEPFVLTRCKSAPMRTAAAAKLPPETCFWNNRKMEPHRRSTFGVGAGAAGVGF